MPHGESGAGPGTWLVLVVDDEPAVHDVTRLALGNLEFEGRGITFVSAYSASEAMEALRVMPDIAVILLDVVMESDRAGLEVIAFAREQQQNACVRIVLRTGQPGQAPERHVVARYDIHDYKTKVELTSSKLSTAVLSSLRTYKQLRALEAARREAEATTAALRRFVPGELVALLGRRGLAEVAPGDRVERTMAVMVADIRGFAELRDTCTAADCFRLVNDVFGALAPVIRGRGGFIDRLLGAGFVAVFPGSADDAMQAAVGLQQRIRERNAARGEAIAVDVGIHAGPLVFGTIGDAERMATTVLSDAVEVAAGLAAMRGASEASAVVSLPTLAQVRDPAPYAMVRLGELQIAGRADEVPAYGLMGLWASAAAAAS
jgi:two-component system sensor histidine kinase ChiS